MSENVSESVETKAPRVVEAPKDVDQSSKRYTRAVAALKAAHADEFQALMDAEYAKDGVVRVRRLTPEERDAKTVAEAKAKAAAKVAELRAIYGEDILNQPVTEPTV